VDVKSILHIYFGMKQINMNCSPTDSVDFAKERKHFLSIKEHTIIQHILLIDFRFIKSKSSTLFLHHDHLNFMLETWQRASRELTPRGLNFECPRAAGIQQFDLSLSDLDAPKPPLQDSAQKTSKFLPSIFEFWPAKQAIRPTV
jgi:hypothetical protein